jgi:hypothetical protein
MYMVDQYEYDVEYKELMRLRVTMLEEILSSDCVMAIGLADGEKRCYIHRDSLGYTVHILDTLQRQKIQFIIDKWGNIILDHTTDIDTREKLPETTNLDEILTSFHLLEKKQKIGPEDEPIE